MKRSTDRILTTHTGSLPLPALVRQAHGAKKRGAAYDQRVVDSTLTTAIDDIVRRQVEVGVDVVGDGELSKTSWNDYVVHRVSGLERRPRSRAVSAEPWSVSTGITRPRESGLVRREIDGAPRHYRTDIAEFYDLARTQSDAHDNDGMTYFCAGPLGWKDFAAVKTDIARLQAAARSAQPHDVFMSALSPGCFARFFKNEHYPNEETYMQAVADVMRDEYQAIVDAGFVLQLDCPDLASGANTDYADLNVREFRKVIEQHIECLNYALKSIPQEQARMHVCWGNYAGPHHRDIALIDIIDIVLKANVTGITIESSNPRHGHEWQVWQDVKLPEGKILFPGVIDDISLSIEHPELVAERLVRFAKLVGKENVIGCTDCGLRHLPDANLALAKLYALAEGARLASQELWR
ncbi:MAG: epoxyalkane--coenzyme M transferase [Deltaproteobacteria bacterium]|nr:epoxyalkane--coenzyme M transferase [Deltaproteobacteria bacterium]